MEPLPSPPRALTGHSPIYPACLKRKPIPSSPNPSIELHNRGQRGSLHESILSPGPTDYPNSSSIQLLDSHRRVPSSSSCSSTPEVLYVGHHHDPWYRVWLAEILCILVGILALGGIIVILGYFNGKPQPNLSLGFTLNSILQYLSSLTKWAFMIPLIEILGQLKWIRFAHSPHGLRDFELYDEAARRMFGSVRLILFLKGIWKQPLTWIAALVALSSIFTSAVTQQVLTLTANPVVLGNGTAIVTRATDVSRWNGTGYTILKTDEYDFISSILSASVINPSSELPATDPTCSTANCSWPTFTTLGICAQTFNLSTAANKNSTLASLMHLNIKVWATLLQNLSTEDYSAVSRHLVTFGNQVNTGPTGLVDRDKTGAVLSDFIVYFSKGAINITDPALGLDDFEAVEVVLSVCTRTYSTVVSEGRATTTEMDKAIDIASESAESMNWDWSIGMREDEAFLDETPDLGGCFDQDPTRDAVVLHGGTRDGNDVVGNGLGKKPRNYTMDWCTGLGISAIIRSQFWGFRVQKGAKDGSVSAGPIFATLSSAVHGSMFSHEVLTPQEQFQRVGAIAENIAESLSNKLREPGFLNTLEESPDDLILGTAYAPQSVVSIVWEWLTLLVAQLGITILLLGATIYQASNSTALVLKGSTLATVCALDTETREAIGPVGSVQGLKEQARGVKVAMVPDQGGMRLRKVRMGSDTGQGDVM